MLTHPSKLGDLEPQRHSGSLRTALLRLIGGPGSTGDAERPKSNDCGLKLVFSTSTCSAMSASWSSWLPSMSASIDGVGTVALDLI